MKMIVWICLITLAVSNYCSMETCRRCCQVTPTGCIDAMDYNIRVNYYNLGKIYFLYVFLPRL